VEIKMTSETDLGYDFARGILKNEPCQKCGQYSDSSHVAIIIGETCCLCIEAKLDGIGKSRNTEKIVFFFE
jgi:hypothetical protein